MNKKRTQYNTSLLQDRMRFYIKKHGGVRNLAKILEVDPSYVCRLRDGFKTEPNDKILRTLKLVKMVVYVDDGTHPINKTAMPYIL